MLGVRRYSSFVVTSCLLIGCGGDAELGSDSGVLVTDGGMPDAQEPETLPPDLCLGVVASCPSGTATIEGTGLTSIEACAFPMQALDRWQETGGLLDSLAQDLVVVGMADLLGDLNRNARARVSVPGNPPGLQQSFSWDTGDDAVDYWIPQGISTSANAVDGGQIDGSDVALVSWYYEEANDEGSTQDKGVRISVADTSNALDVRYRHVLLVEPALVDGHASYKAVHVHAGGIAWVGHYLYVVHTGVGLRIFDLDRLMRVSTGVDAIGYDGASGEYYAHNYAYVLPQVETIKQVSECGPRFSFISLDRSSDPPSLLTGEYDAAAVTGRLFRWPLKSDDGLPALVEGNRLYPEEAFLSGQSHIQGALSFEGDYWLSSSKPAAGAGVLYRTAPGSASESLSWTDSPEDLAYDPIHEAIWGLSEKAGARYVFRSARSAL